MRYLQADSHARYSLIYQPLIQTDARPRVYGVEALLRMSSGLPIRARIDHAENSGEIGAIDDWVLCNACEQVAPWCHQGRPMQLSINISGAQLDNETFPRRLEKILSASKLSASRLTFELSPRFVLPDSGPAFDVLCQLHEMGIGILRDNFGTERAGMQDLKKPYLTGVKVSFGLVDNLAINEADRVMLCGIRDVCRSGNKKLLVSGVESSCQRTILCELGITLQQGYLHGGPMTPAMFDLLWSE